MYYSRNAYRPLFTVQGRVSVQVCFGPGGSLSRGWSLCRGSLSRESLSRGSMSRGWSLSRGVSVQGMVSVQGISVQGVSIREPHPSCGQTDTCEIITLPQTSFTGGKYEYQMGKITVMTSTLNSGGSRITGWGRHPKGGSTILLFWPLFSKKMH